MRGLPEHGKKDSAAVSTMDGMPFVDHALGKSPLHGDVSRRRDHHGQRGCGVRQLSYPPRGVSKSSHFAMPRKAPETSAKPTRRSRSAEQDFRNVTRGLVLDQISDHEKGRHVLVGLTAARLLRLDSLLTAAFVHPPKPCAVTMRHNDMRMSRNLLDR
jgi:hypothetical protein